MAYRYFKELSRRTASDKVLRDKPFNMAKNSKCDGCQKDFDSIVYKSFDKKFSGVNTVDDAVKSEIILNQRPLYLAKNNYAKQFLEYSKNKKYAHLLLTIFGVLILHICNK